MSLTTQRKTITYKYIIQVLLINKLNILQFNNNMRFYFTQYRFIIIKKKYIIIQFSWL